MTEVEGFGFIRLPIQHSCISGNFDSINRQFRTQQQNLDSIARKMKLLKQTLESGEQERIAESTETWKDVIGQVIPKLKEHLNQECSMHKFVSKILKIDLNRFGINFYDDDEEDEQSEEKEFDDEKSVDKENFNEAKRYKYEE